MTPTFITMIIWISISSGHPATLTGFDSLQSCNNQKNVVAKEFALLSNADVEDIQISCVELKK